MRKVLRQIIALSNDHALTDKMFRRVVQRLPLERKRNETSQECLNRLRMEEIYERERELYVH